MSLRTQVEMTARSEKIENCLIFYRWITLGLVGIFLFGELLGRPAPHHTNSSGVIILVVSAILYNLLLTAYSTQVFAKLKRYPLLLSIDVIISALLIVATGGFVSSFYLYGLSPILIGAYTHKMRGALVSATVLSILYHLSLYANGNSLRQLMQLDVLNQYIIQFAGFFLVAFFFSLPLLLIDDLEQETHTQDLCKQRLLSFYDVAGAINSSLQLKKVLNLVVNNAHELAKADTTALALFTKGQDLEIEPRSIVVRDNGQAHLSPELKEYLEDLRMYICDAKPVFLRQKDLTTKSSSFAQDAELLINVPLIRKGRRQGMLILVNPQIEKDSDDFMLLSVLAGLASVAIENAQLVEKTQNLMILEERNRIARDMHDGLAQSLFSMVLNLEVCTRLVDSRPSLVKEKLIELQKMASRNLREMRQYIYDLCPSELRQMGLCGALDMYTKEFTSVNGLIADFEIIGKAKRLSEDIEKALYYIAQEALSNARRHAHAEFVSVQLSYSDDHIALRIEDDGRGFEARKIQNNAVTMYGRGLSNIEKRVSVLGGAYSVFGEIGSGTRVEVKIPLS